MKHNSLSKALATAGTVGVLSLPMIASATVTIDPTEVLATVAEAVAFITAVGLAVLSMTYVARGIKWARKAG